MPKNALQILADEVVACSDCPRLVAHRRNMAEVKRRAYRDWDYWGKPVPPFGDPNARLLIVGLAPAAHGGNRTGRMFTGDRSGDFLYRALYETGFASQPESHARGDGQKLTDAYITAAVRCAPPDNKPTPEEFQTCRRYLERELALLKNLKCVVALGKLAFDTYLNILRDQDIIRSRAPYIFGHNVQYKIADAAVLVGSYHPSQQNTSTGKLTAEMLRDVFDHARTIIEAARSEGDH
jgi:uracil-DNA glycosylase family 4